MSNYFSNKNDKEFGPGPSQEQEWLIVQNPHDINGVTQCAVVRGKTAFVAWEEAEKLIPNFSKQHCQCFPNPVLRFTNWKCINSSVKDPV